MFKRKNYSLNSETFLKQMEKFIAEETYYRQNSLSASELYALRYQSEKLPSVNQDTKIQRITSKDLTGLLNGDTFYSLLMHEIEGFLYPDDNRWTLKTPNGQKSYTRNLILSSLNKRMIFFVRETGAMSENVCFTKILVYIPQREDTTIFFDACDFDEEISSFMLPNNDSFVNFILQENKQFDRNSDFCGIDFGKEFFAFTKLTINDVMYIIHYVPY